MADGCGEPNKDKKGIKNSEQGGTLEPRNPNIMCGSRSSTTGSYSGENMWKGTSLEPQRGTTRMEEDQNEQNQNQQQQEQHQNQQQQQQVPHWTLCSVCHGEGKLIRPPSRKARWKQQRNSKQQQDKDKTDHNANNLQDNGNRVQGENNDATTTTTIKVQGQQLPRRRIDACTKCQGSGLLLQTTAAAAAGSTSTNNSTIHVGIVGGGLAGLALATACRHRPGLRVTVFERDEHFHQRLQGYGLTLQQASSSLKCLGILHPQQHEQLQLHQPHLRSSGGAAGAGFVTSTKHVVHKADGTIVGEWGLRIWGNNKKNTNKTSTTTTTTPCMKRQRRPGDADVVSAAAANGGRSCDANAVSASPELVEFSKNVSDKEANPTSILDANDDSQMLTNSQNQALQQQQPRRQNIHIARQALRYQLLQTATAKDGTAAAAAGNDDQGESIIKWNHKFLGFEPVGHDPNASEEQPNLAVDASQQQQPHPPKALKLKFAVGGGRENEPETRCAEYFVDVLVGADGIRSQVRKQLLGNKNNNNNGGDDKQDDFPLRYLDCIVILGICPLKTRRTTTTTTMQAPDTGQHEQQRDDPHNSGTEEQQQPCVFAEDYDLLDGETVFQTADGTTRIYMMPYSDTEYMWQLSFPLPSEQEALELSQRGPAALQAEAIRRCGMWHDPIGPIVKATPVELISGYPVYDRALLTWEQLQAYKMVQPQQTPLPVTLIGDACHPMSPFKGQGANQALLDALSLARSLYRVVRALERQQQQQQQLQMSPALLLSEAICDFEKEMLQRSAVKVQASAEAARFLHTDVAIQEGNVTRGAAAAATRRRN